MWHIRWHKKWPKWLGVLSLAAVLGILVAGVTLSSQAAQLAGAQPDTSPSTDIDLPRREVSVDGQSPAISLIDSASATCFLPAPKSGACYIEWDYLYVTAGPGQFVISMTVAIDDQVRAYHGGFFQTYMYIPGDMTAPGYRVACGVPGSGGKAAFGMTYNYVIRARETGGLKSANYGSVTCPADLAQVYLPLIEKQ